MTELKTLKDIGVEDLLGELEVNVDEYNGRLRKEAIKHIKKQQVPNYKKIEIFFHCKNCLSQNQPSSELEVGYTQSQSKIIIQCKRCRLPVNIINLAETQNDWIKYFFNITEEDLK